MSWVSHAHRVILFHVPRTGGTSQVESLKAAGIRLAPYAVGRLGWDMITDHSIEIPRGAEQYTTVATVRNPYDRMLSLYLWLRLQAGGDPINLVAQVADFTTYLRFLDRYNRDCLGNQTYQLFHGPQCEYLEQVRLDRLLHYENLEVDWRAFTEECFGRAVPLLRSPRTLNQPYCPCEHYTPDAAEIVARICRDSFELYGYDIEKRPC